MKASGRPIQLQQVSREGGRGCLESSYVEKKGTSFLSVFYLKLRIHAFQTLALTWEPAREMESNTSAFVQTDSPALDVKVMKTLLFF